MFDLIWFSAQEAQDSNQQGSRVPILSDPFGSLEESDREETSSLAKSTAWKVDSNWIKVKCFRNERSERSAFTPRYKPFRAPFKMKWVNLSQESWEGSMTTIEKLSCKRHGSELCNMTLVWVQHEFNMRSTWVQHEFNMSSRAWLRSIEIDWLRGFRENNRMLLWLMPAEDKEEARPWS